MYRHRLNWVKKVDAPGEGVNEWIGTVATTYANLTKYSPQYFRCHAGQKAQSRFPKFEEFVNYLAQYIRDLCGEIELHFTSPLHFFNYSVRYFLDHFSASNWIDLPDGGWHFTSIGDNDALRLKHVSVIEGNDNPPTDEQITEEVKGIYRAVSVDDTYPGYVLQNYDYFVSIGFIDPQES